MQRMPIRPATSRPWRRPVPSTLTRLMTPKARQERIATVLTIHGPAPGITSSAIVPMPISAKAAFNPIALQLINPATVPRKAPRLRSTTK